MNKIFKRTLLVILSLLLFQQCKQEDDSVEDIRDIYVGEYDFTVYETTFSSESINDTQSKLVGKVDTFSVVGFVSKNAESSNELDINYGIRTQTAPVDKVAFPTQDSILCRESSFMEIGETTSSFLDIRGKKR